MNAVSLVDGPFADDLFPFSLTRSVADIRCGILTIREKWNGYLSRYPGLAGIFSVPSNVLPSPSLLESLSLPRPDFDAMAPAKIQQPSDILRYNASEITADYRLLTSGRKSAPISVTNHLTGTDIFFEAGVKAEHCYLNASEGPIYIGREVQIMEGSMIRGPFAAGEKTVVKMGSKIYGATTAGPHCVLGGEIKNSVLFGYSNKAHDGYLGDSVIGEWCNLGAGTSNSNVKNSAGIVSYWNPLTNRLTESGVKSGLLMGDYSRSAIHTAFNTGTVVGVCCHVFGNGLSPAYLSSFSWGFGHELYEFDKAIQHITRWKKFKGQELGPEEIKQLKAIFDQQTRMT